MRVLAASIKDQRPTEFPVFRPFSIGDFTMILKLGEVARFIGGFFIKEV